VRFEDFHIHSVIGQGNYGEVLLADHLPTRRCVAVKRFHLSQLSDVDLLYFCREVGVLAHCRHPFIVEFIGFSATPPYCIATEYVPNGSLHDALQRSALTPSQKSVIALAIAHGMAFLHRQNIIHRDLKPLNILLDARLLLKICDFGISRFVAAEGASRMTASIGTPAWIAPEMFESTAYDTRVDVYAFGVIVWSMLTDTQPFPGRDGLQIAFAVCKNGERPVIPRDAPRGLSDLIRACWAQECAARPPFEAVAGWIASGRAVFTGTDREHLRNAVHIDEHSNPNSDLLFRILQRGKLTPLHSTARDN
jgi:serine/threonine protein kinase